MIVVGRLADKVLEKGLRIVHLGPKAARITLVRCEQYKFACENTQGRLTCMHSIMKTN